MWLHWRCFLNLNSGGRHDIVAIRALAHKLARAAYYMLREQKPFEVSRLFAH
jgi:hypothetical protein